MHFSLQLALRLGVALVAVGGAGAFCDGGSQHVPSSAVAGGLSAPALRQPRLGFAGESEQAVAIIREIFEAQDELNSGYISCDEAVAAAKQLGALSSARFEAFNLRDGSQVTLCMCPLTVTACQTRARRTSANLHVHAIPWW